MSAFPAALSLMNPLVSEAQLIAGAEQGAKKWWGHHV